MQSKSQIIVHNLSFIFPNGRNLFKNLSVSFGHEKAGFIGKNGTGKSSLLKLITDELQPTNGRVETLATLAYCPQQYYHENDRVSDVLGVADKLQALSRITTGSANEKDVEVLADDWDIKNRTYQQLAQFDLSAISLAMPFSQLSGGERTRLLLTRTFLQQANFIILDEPTNNLDVDTRQQLYKAIQASSCGFLIVSHDRALLNLMDSIVELTSKGINHYGGNYDAYVEQKETLVRAQEQMVQARTEELKKAKQLVQTRKERHEQSRSKGRKAKQSQVKAAGQYDKLGFKLEQERSEKTNRRIGIQANRKLSSVNEQLSEAKDKLEIHYKMDVDIPKTFVPNSKMILNIESLTFAYPNKHSLFKSFDSNITGPEHIALSGANGSGKTTLIKLILNKLKPDSGKIELGTKSITYLDQSVELLDTKTTLIENFQRLNPRTSTTDAYRALAHFIFRNKEAEKLVAQLSGGEKIRAGLACTLLSENPPQLLILDEPTNHLDLSSIANIELALHAYQGALIVISHDQTFLENIGITRNISLSLT